MNTFIKSTSLIFVCFLVFTLLKTNQADGRPTTNTNVKVAVDKFTWIMEETFQYVCDSECQKKKKLMEKIKRQRADNPRKTGTQTNAMRMRTSIMRMHRYI